MFEEKRNTYETIDGGDSKLALRKCLAMKALGQIVVGTHRQQLLLDFAPEHIVQCRLLAGEELRPDVLVRDLFLFQCCAMNADFASCSILIALTTMLGTPLLVICSCAQFTVLVMCVATAAGVTVICVFLHRKCIGTKSQYRCSSMKRFGRAFGAALCRLLRAMARGAH